MPMLEDSELFRAALDALESGVYIVDRERRILFWNRMAERITGYTAAEVMGRLCRDNLLVDCREDGRVQCLESCPLKETLQDGTPRTASLFLRHKQGHRLPVHVTTSVLRDAEGRAVGGVEAFTEQTLSPERRLDQMRNAGLAGDHQGTERRREHMEARLERDLELCARERQTFGVLELHVDQWQGLRTTHGKEAAEAMIGILAETLVYTLHPSDAFGRWNDDEFLVIARDSSLRALELDAELLRSMAASAQFRWWGDKIPLTLSIGGAIVQPVDTVDSLLARARTGLRFSLDRGGNCITVLENTEHQVAEEAETCSPS